MGIPTCGLTIRAGETASKCIGGRLGCQSEDVGEVWGYKEFLDVYNDKKHSGHEERMEWVGEYFDPERFDLTEVNEILSPEQ